jgi:hypothetical protein
VLFGGALLMLGAAAAGGWLGWENRNAIVRVHAGDFVWTGHLYAVLIVGALLACWFLLGVAFIRCRIAERRRGSALRRSAASGPAQTERMARRVGVDPKALARREVVGRL